MAFTSAHNTVGYLPRAAGMLTAQIRAIGGKGTHTPQDRQPCRLLRKIPTRTRTAGVGRFQAVEVKGALPLIISLLEYAE